MRSERWNFDAALLLICYYLLAAMAVARRLAKNAPLLQIGSLCKGWGKRTLCTAGGRRQLLSSLQLFSVCDEGAGQANAAPNGCKATRNPYKALGRNRASERRCSAWEWVLDVRSPKEFQEDRIVAENVLSVPVLDDEERCAVGTEFTQGSKHEARMEGASLISTRIGQIIARDLAGRTKEGDRLLVYCWRGGMRSRSLATVLTYVGFKVQLLEGGYRSYRRAVTAFLEEEMQQFRFIIISGPTGSGKGRVLEALASEGGQVLDLEGLAMHRGSTFGAMQSKQPSQKLFESKLVAELASMDPERPVFVESESRLVGTCHLPSSLAAGMRVAERAEVVVPMEERVKWIRSCYRHFEDEQHRETLFSALAKLTAMAGKERVAAWKEMATAAEWQKLVEELLVLHYDPAYGSSRKKLSMQGTTQSTIHLENLGDDEALRRAAVSLLASKDPLFVE